MREIKCPSCGKNFKIDPSNFDQLLSQIKNEEFNKQIEERLHLAKKEKNKEIELIKTELKLEMIKEKKEMEKIIISLQSKLNLIDKDKLNELNSLRNESEKKINNLNTKIEKLNNEIKNQAETLELSKEKEIINALSKVEEEKIELRISLEKIKQEKNDSEKALEKRYQEIIKERDLKITDLRDMQLKLSTKMQGETLEKHCENEFNKIRSTGFQTSIFEKDNDSSTGSKGDYIFREFDNENLEIISIMFEMKNESQNSTNKKKNEDYFKELNKDRNEKSCEYAVLVSLLEPDSELYNAGIVDVSHRFPKMYVIRPQFFLPIISLLRNASMETLKYKSQIDLMKRENYDITNFESTLEQFKNAVGKNVSLAQDRFNDAITEIDKSISHLQKTKEALILSKKHLLSADSKSQDLTVKKLTKNNPTMKKKFDDLNNFEDQVA